MPGLPRLLRRLVAVALFAAVLAGAQLGVIAPLHGRFAAYAEAIAQGRDLLARFQRASTAAPALAAQVEELRLGEGSSGFYLEGASDTLAAAVLQDRLSRLLEQSGGALRSVQTLPARREDGFIRVTVRAQLVASIEAAHEILYALETAKPFLFLDNVDIRRQLSRRRRTSEADHGAGELELRFDVFGYMLAPAA